MCCRGKTCICGAASIQVDEHARTMSVMGPDGKLVTMKEGDRLTKTL